MAAGVYVGRDKGGTTSGMEVRALGAEWVLTTNSGDREIYSKNGRLLRLVTRAGLTTTLTYDYPDLRGRLISVTGPYGHALTLAYDPNGMLSTVSDAGGIFVTYSYTTGNLTDITYRDGSVRSYHYEDPRHPNQLTGISNTGTRYATFAYDDYGRATLTEHAGGIGKQTLTYNADGTTTVTDAAGNATVYTYSTPNAAPRLITKITDAAGVQSRTYDVYNRLASRTDERNIITTYTYDTYHLTSKTEAAGTPLSRTTSYQYLSNSSDVPTVTESPSVAGGTNKKRTTLTYSDTRFPALPTAVTQTGFTPSGQAIARSVTLSYDAQGRVTAIDGPRIDIPDLTSFTYYDCTTGGACGQLQSVTNALGQTTTYDSYDANGRVLSVTDPNGLNTAYAYDLRDRVTTLTQTAPGGASRVTQYTYDARGNVAATTPATGLVLTYTYNAANELTRITDSLGNHIDYTYDLKGNRTQTYTYDPVGALVRAVDLTFDTRNRVNQVNNGGSVTKQISDAVGNLTAVTDPNTVAANGTIATTHQYDALNRLTKTIDLLAGNTQYTYDQNDRLKTAQAPNGAATQYQYDDLGNLLTETSPDRGTLVYTYDAAGNLTSLKDARNVTTTYSYDALNRVTQVNYPDPAENITYTRKLPRQVDSSEVELPAVKSRCRKRLGGNPPSDACGRRSL